MEFGTIVELKADVTQGETTFPKGMLLAVAHYVKDYKLQLNTFGSEKPISHLLEIDPCRTKNILRIVGKCAPKIKPVARNKVNIHLRQKSRITKQKELSTAYCPNTAFEIQEYLKSKQ
ncbi:P-loop NTPase family protein [Thalassotalea eurytherma]|uniref:Uncharacterized protein n=1 Tax=Thalassotalea eurytherma TaxID=1144278 RepID=A0ABQ6H3R2_9GAMM|nr:hypothetical protein [Thalassotalea eurytherma]GLX82811.1 hypothetical protein theurythT_22630 [Thalassotalea eurytherma]